MNDEEQAAAPVGEMLEEQRGATEEFDNHRVQRCLDDLKADVNKVIRPLLIAYTRQTESLKNLERAAFFVVGVGAAAFMYALIEVFK